jgi:hypothetical protein
MNCKCGEPHDGWPGEGDGQLCQMCWEAECDESWWRMVMTLPGAACPESEYDLDGGERR